MCCASVRAIEQRSRSFQSGPVGQYEYTNAAAGGGWRHLRNSTNALRGNLVEIMSPSPPSRWHFVFASRQHCSIASNSTECHFKPAGFYWPSIAIASCPSSAAASE